MSIVGDVEHVINMRTGDSWVRLRTEGEQLVSVILKSTRLQFSRGTSAVFFGRWAPVDNADKIFVADSGQEATRRFHLTRAEAATRATRNVYVRKGSAIDLRVRKDLARLFSDTEDLD